MSNARPLLARARDVSHRGRWVLLGLLIAASAVLGFVGLGSVEAPSSNGGDHLLPLLDRMYDTVLLFKMTLILPPPYPWELEVAQWLAPLAVIFTAFTAAAAIFARQWGELRVRLGYRGHVVVCGLGNCGARLAPLFHERGMKVVVVDKDLTEAADPAGVEACRERGIPVVVGDATDDHVLRRAGIGAAGYLVAVCGGDETNAEVALAARRSLAPARRSATKATSDVGAPARIRTAGNGAGPRTTAARTTAASVAAASVAGASGAAVIEGSVNGSGTSEADDAGSSGGARPARHSLRCFIQVADDRLCRLLEESALADPSRSNVRLEFFNVSRSGLKALLDEHGGVLLEEGAPPHLLVIGTGRLARQLVAEAARRWWLWRGNLSNESNDRNDSNEMERCRTTLVAPDAKDAVVALHERFPALRLACDLVAVEADLSEPDSPPISIALDSPLERCLAVVCFDNDDAAAVRATIVGRRSLPEAVPLVVCTRGQSALPGLLGAPGSVGLPNVTDFGLLDRACAPEALLNGIPEELARSVHADYLRRRREELAKSFHELYVGSRTAPDRPVPQPDDPSLRPWSELPEILRESNRDQAADIGRKLALVGCHLEPSPAWDAVPKQFSPEEVELLGQAEHDRWCEERLRNGWRLGPVKDPVARTHPDIRPWDELTEPIKDLDRDAVRAIPGFLARLGYAIVPSGHDRRGEPAHASSPH
ncbi:MAG TPA: NAD-binding protein [Acidimicrobiales bacterium]|nr:NAD-binding protein [Acidimicrobiales bacterium]